MRNYIARNAGARTSRCRIAATANIGQKIGQSAQIASGSGENRTETSAMNFGRKASCSQCFSDLITQPYGPDAPRDVGVMWCPHCQRHVHISVQTVFMPDDDVQFLRTPAKSEHSVCRKSRTEPINGARNRTETGQKCPVDAIK